MGKDIVQWFLYCLVISIFAAYLFSRLLASGTAFLQVFRVVGTVALLGYTVRRQRMEQLGIATWLAELRG